MNDNANRTIKKRSYGALLQNTVGEADRQSTEEKKPAPAGTSDSIAARFTALRDAAKKGS